MQGCPFATRSQVSTQEPRTPVCVCVCVCACVCVTLCVWGTNFDFKAYRTKETNLIRKPRSCCENPRISNYSDLSFADRHFLLFGRNHIWVLCSGPFFKIPAARPARAVSQNLGHRILEHNSIFVQTHSASQKFGTQNPGRHGCDCGAPSHHYADRGEARD